MLNKSTAPAASTVKALDEEAQERVRKISRTDIIVGIPSYNNAQTIGRVIKAAELGIAKYFPRNKAIIIVS